MQISRSIGKFVNIRQNFYDLGYYLQIRMLFALWNASNNDKCFL